MQRTEKRNPEADSAETRRNVAFWRRCIAEKYLMILAYARVLVNGDISRAEDLAQTVAVRVLTYLPDHREIRNLTYFLRRITKNAWISSRRPTEVGLDDLIESDLDNPALIVPPDILKKLEDEEFLKPKPGPSSDKLRLTLELLGQGYAFEEIATILGEKPNQTKYRYYKYLQLLRERFARGRNRK